LLTAGENVIMPLAFARRVPRSQWHERATRLLEAVDLADRQHYYPHQLSTGQRMRVAVARALACDPGVLLADEPTAALDSGNANRVMDLLQEVSVRSGASLVVASHDPAVAARFVKVADIHDGTVTFGEIEPV
jgi:ABC-type lipoprotein export system ATPase subunit